MPPASTERRIELTLAPEVHDLDVEGATAELIERLRDRLPSPESELHLVETYPRTDKVLLQTENQVAEDLAREAVAGHLEDEGVVDAYLGPSAPDEEADLEFDREPMVKWFDPLELVRAGVKALVSSLFGSYADQREVQAVQAALRASLHGSGQGEDSPIGPERSGPQAEREAAEYPDTQDPADLEDLIAREVRDYSDRSELWVDYVADLGDGWDPTYSIARLLAEETLTVQTPTNAHTTERGNVLVMGGDQVYPTAKREEYRNRLVGPYRAALPAVLGNESPDLFAIPGNHDWYDGLTSFTRLFCQNRWIGGWKTRQERSYFAVRLPHDWWLWGIDVQLDSDIDRPQYEYFQTLARHIEDGSNVILCTAEPSWVYAEQKGREAFQNLEYFERTILRENGLHMAVALAGDLHNYARYEENGSSSEHEGSTGERIDQKDTAAGPRQRIVSGGGGAYLYPTHQMPEELSLPDPEPRAAATGPETSPESRFTLGGIFPSADDSKRASWRALLLPFENVQFAGVLGAFYLLLAWLTQSASKMITAIETPFLETLAGLSFLAPSALPQVGVAWWRVLRHSPATVALVLLLFGGLVGFSDRKQTAGKLGLGLVHTSVHVVAALLLMWSLAEFNFGVLNLRPDALGQALLFSLEMLTAGGVLGGALFGAYLVGSNRLLYLDRSKKRRADRTPTGGPLRGVHANEVFSCQSIPDFKQFVRLHVREDGDLAIYPIGVEEVAHTWRYRPGAASGKPWFEAAEQPIPERAELIEEPIVVRRRTS